MRHAMGCINPQVSVFAQVTLAGPALASLVHALLPPSYCVAQALSKTLVYPNAVDIKMGNLLMSIDTAGESLRPLDLTSLVRPQPQPQPPPPHQQQPDQRAQHQVAPAAAAEATAGPPHAAAGPASVPGNSNLAASMAMHAPSSPALRYVRVRALPMHLAVPKAQINDSYGGGVTCQLLQWHCRGQCNQRWARDLLCMLHC